MLFQSSLNVEKVTLLVRVKIHPVHLVSYSQNHSHGIKGSGSLTSSLLLSSPTHSWQPTIDPQHLATITGGLTIGAV